MARIDYHPFLSIMRELGALGSFWPEPNPPKRKNAALSLRGDWAKIGQDMAKAIEVVAAECPQKATTDQTVKIRWLKPVAGQSGRLVAIRRYRKRSKAHLKAMILKKRAIAK
jgi:hypothetical protein